MTDARVTLEVADDVATITLRRADARNAIDRRFVEELGAAVDGAIAPGAARAVLLIADGPAFTVGGDIEHFRAHAERMGDEIHEMIDAFHGALGRLADCELPVVCGARGAAAGGGLGMLWASDIVIAGDDLKLATAFARIALTGDGGWSYYLVRLVGLRRALELLLENRALSAQEALDWGLVTRVVPAAEVADEARRTAARLAEGPTVTLGRLRRLARDGAARSLHEQLDAELGSIRDSAAAADAQEAVTAFLERRAPHFTGR